jgi:hypothetical protein
MNIITKSNRKAYLAKKQPAYQSGWFAAEKGYPLKPLNGSPKTQFYYENGYNDCKANEYTVDGQPTSQEKIA